MEENKETSKPDETTRTDEATRADEATGLFEVQCIPATVTFDEFEHYKNRALEIADFVQQVKVTPENVKASKKMLAQTRAIVNALDRERLAIKKKILKPYEVFESQVKELKKIVDDADSIVRNQVRQLEEQERLQKRDDLAEVFAMRLKHYDFEKVPNLFERWLKPEHLNKSCSLSKAEKDMAEFLTRIDTDISFLAAEEESGKLLPIYFETLSVRETLERVKAEKAKAEANKAALQDIAIANSIEEPDLFTIHEQIVAFIVTGTSEDIQRVQTLLDGLKLKYEKQTL